MTLDFDKYPDGLVPAVVQDSRTSKVLMLGFMNAEALSHTESTKRATFYSRSRGRLWTKGEQSGNHLIVEQILTDCDNDTVLIRATPAGPTCHTGEDTCFGERNSSDNFLSELEKIIRNRKLAPSPTSYTSNLFARGLNKIAQKVGEEAVETVIASKDADRDAFMSETADLLYHLLVLLVEKVVSLAEVEGVLRERAK